MTREERKIALYCLKAYSDYHSEVCEECIKYPNCDHTIQDDVIETIIKALEQEPCEDAISREQAIRATYGFERYTGIDEAPYEYAESILRDLPSVTPQQKTGHWIDKEEKTAVCSCCNRNNLLYGDFCKWCGTKMTEPQKSENEGMYIACKKCKYNYNGECDFYDMGSGNEIDMPCYKEKELIKKAADYFVQAFVGQESEEVHDKK